MTDPNPQGETARKAAEPAETPAQRSRHAELARVFQQDSLKILTVSERYGFADLSCVAMRTLARLARLRAKLAAQGGAR